MSDEEVEHIKYEDELWTLHDPHPALADFLTARDCLIVLRQGEPPFQVVLGVPHQAAVGEEHIWDRRFDQDGKPPRDSDENAASYALVAFSTLRDRGVPCKLVIMAHATTHDPNKKPDSPYCEEVLRDETALLFECHGASDRRPHSLELSAGCNHLSHTLRFGRALARALGHQYSLGIQKEPGGKDALILQQNGSEEDGQLKLAARGTRSLMEATVHGIPALHLEAVPAFRKPPNGSNTVTPDGLVLGRAIAQAITKYLSETKPLADLAMDTFIKLPHGGSGAGFHVSEIVSHIQSTGMDYIIQGQQNCSLKNHTKPHSLDVWLRKGYARNKDTKQAVNEVMDALVATGWFEVVKNLTCPDRGTRVKGLRLVDPSEPQ
jgi:hypothetical protein